MTSVAHHRQMDAVRAGERGGAWRFLRHIDRCRKRRPARRRRVRSPADAEPEALASSKPDVRRLLGKEGDYGRKLGLDNAWALNAVKAVGNYSEGV